MVFKLVRIDAAEPCKIKLPLGKHVIGRDRFLFENEHDNRVSRNHAEILVTANEVTLTALHINPCFYIKKSEKDTFIITQNSTVSLFCGDKFGILPNNYWYELIFCADLPDDESCSNDKQEETIKNIPDVNKAEIAEGNGRSSPSLLQPDSPTQQYNWEVYYSPVREDEDDDPKAAKRPLTPDLQNEDVKKAKNAPADAVDQAGPSNERKPNDKANDGNPGPAKPVDDAVVRERCMYGASCYRRNVCHRAQLSHPGDADWAAGEGRACAWGAACRRRDPRHRRDYLHPPQPPQPPHPPHPRPPRDDIGRQVVERHGNVFYINAHTVNFYDDHFQVEDSDGDSVDYDYEF